MRQELNQIYKFINSHFVVFVTIAIVLSLILIGLVGGNVWKMYEGFSKVVTTEFELQNLTGEIVYLDEALTMSARMAAATGNLDWEKRYLKLQPQLDNDIKKLMAIAPETYEPHAIETNAANVELVEMEQKSFNLVRQGKKEAAFKLLLSQQYQFDKEIYAEGIDKTVAALQTRIKYNINSYSENLFMSALFSAIQFPILLLVWGTILSLINWYVLQRKRTRRILQTVNLELKKANKTLESKVKERTSELEKAAAKAEKANKSKDVFLANITHELRSPLNSILGYTKVLQKESNLNSKQLDRLNIIWQSSTHLLTLINDILDFSKTNNKKIELHPKRTDLPNFLDGIFGIAKMWAEEKGLTLNLETPQQLPTNIEADEKRLRQVLINLLSNAVKFTVSGEVTLKVIPIEDGEISFSEFERVTLRFEISDTGIGMDSEEIEKIFQPFEQIGDLESKDVGAGLGLSIAKQLVELMGSELKVKSELGKGSTFWFDATFIKAEISEHLEPEILGYQGKRRKLLVVDDKEENRQLLTEILQPMGFEIATASNGQEMLSIATQISPDLILLDLYMPVKTGFTSSKELRQHLQIKDIPIIIITAATISEEMLNYLDCQAVLHKPVNEPELFLNLQKYLDLQWIYPQAS